MVSKLAFSIISQMCTLLQMDMFRNLNAEVIVMEIVKRLGQFAENRGCIVDIVYVKMLISHDSCSTLLVAYVPSETGQLVRHFGFPVLLQRYSLELRAKVIGDYFNKCISTVTSLLLLRVLVLQVELVFTPATGKVTLISAGRVSVLVIYLSAYDEETDHEIPLGFQSRPFLCNLWLQIPALRNMIGRNNFESERKSNAPFKQI